MIQLNPPSQNDFRAAIADWLEITTLLDSRGISTGASILNVLDVLEDHAAEPEPIDPVTGEWLDEAILDDPRNQYVDIAFSELAYRQETLGESYPFSVEMNPYNRHRISRIEAAETPHPGRTVYLFCLLASAIRDGKLVAGEPDAEFGSAKLRIPNIFQICSCMAAGGYIRGEVSSFGFPRANGTNFLAALRETYYRFGVGTVRDSDEIPDGYPTSLKDGGIDVVAWLDHPDKMPGKIYLLGQCASGLNWRQKPVFEYVSQLHGSWFSFAPAQFATPAMFIPFLLHHDLGEERSGPFLAAVKNRFHYDERTFGIIFDRLRIAHFANDCLSLDESKRLKVDGADRLIEVQNWVDDLLRMTLEEAA